MMKLTKIKPILILTMALMIVGFTDGIASDNVEWNILKTLRLDATPIDVAIAPDGKRIYVLTEQGEILVYSSTQRVEGRIEVGKHVDRIKLGPRGDTLFLNSSRNKTLQIATVDFIETINIAGAPFKGREEAPVVIAVFDDFQ
jgi:DNA-binding beta-propeller fold protein YncE